MRKYLFVFVLIVIIASGFIYSLSDESYDYYEKAQALYEEGKYREAHDMLEIGLSINKLNRKIIALKGKLYPIVQGEQNLREATQLYEEAINLALNDKISAAKISMSRAYELASKVTSSSLVKEEADELLRKIARDATLVLDNAPDREFKKALKHENDGKLLRAYEVLNNIDVQSEKIRRKKSDIAFRLAEDKYRDIKGEDTVNEFIVKDIIYWYSQVQPFDDRYEAAGSRISELKLINTK